MITCGVNIQFKMCVRLICSNLIIIVWVSLFLAQVIEGRGSPPKITSPLGNTWPRSTEYARKGGTATFSCRASGEPAPTYIWTVNGTDINSMSLMRGIFNYDKVSGMLTIGSQFSSAFNGDYQCIANNTNGKAMTPFLRILATEVYPFSGNTSTTKDVQAYENEYLELKCDNAPYSVPPLIFLWKRRSQVPGGEDQEVSLNDKRLKIDPDGTLHFLWVEMMDSNFLYTCVGRNSIIKFDATSTVSHRLTVLSSKKSDRSPEIRYNKDVTVVAGDNAELTCIFTYYSSSQEPLQINWFFKGKPVSVDGAVVYGEKITLKKVLLPSTTQTQEGEYQCKASFSSRETISEVNLKIVAPPKFKENQELAGTSVPLGNMATFKCGFWSYNSYTRPTVWLVNAIPVIGCPPHSFECKKSMDGRPVCISSEKRCNSVPDCHDGSDEENCQSASCFEGQKACNGACVDSAVECIEPTCDYPQFSCDSKTKCLQKDSRCNKIVECVDESDEKGCSGGSNITVDRFTITSDRTMLMLNDVKLTDTMCFQCMVTNDYGTLVGDGCLTVIDKINVTLAPNDTYRIYPAMTLVIAVDAVTDSEWQEQMLFKWFWYDKATDTTNGESKTVLPPEGFEDVFFLSADNKVLTINVPNIDEDNLNTYERYNALKDRNYAVMVSHQYDSVYKHFTIEGDQIALPTPAPVVKASLWPQLWFLVLIAGILILFVLVALLVCYKYRNRGGTYPLDKKEVKAGHDPEKELAMDGFTDAGRLGEDIREYDDMLKDENHIN